MPKVDIQDWIKKHPTIVPNADGDGQKDDGLAIAGAKPGVTQKQVYEVVLTAEDVGETERLARERAASARKEMNALPSWHTRSTITGELTAFGLKNIDHLASSGMSSYEERASKMQVDPEEQKNSLLMYYANLEAEEKASQAHSPMDVDEFGLPLPSGSRNSLVIPVAGRTIDRTFSVTSLKRKLELEDDGGSRNKHSRSTSYQSSPPSPIRSKSRDSSSTSSADGRTWQPSQETTPDGKDPMVMVNGVSMPLSQVTDEHHEMMTPEEYEQYAHIAFG